MPSLTGLLMAPVLAIVSGGVVASHHRAIVHSPPPIHVSQAAVHTAAVVSDSAETTPSANDEAKPSENKPPAADDTKSANDQLLADAAALNARYRDYRSGKSHDAVPLYEFRTMEQRLSKVAEADPSNTAVSDMANAMRMIQGEILGPAVQRSMIVKRKMFATEAQSNLGQPDLQVSVAGPANTTVRFQAPSLTRQAVMKMGEEDKLFEQLRMLDFRSAVFTDGRRNRYTYNVAQQRLR